MPGVHCVVPKCYNGTRGLKKWTEEFCQTHQCNKGTSSCTCEPPYRLISFPTERKDAGRRAEWIRLINREDKAGKKWTPRKNSRVCSWHFVDGAPSSSFPSPLLNLGPPRVSETMDPVEALRHFINQRLISAAAEIYTVYHQSINRYQQQIDTQRRLEDIRLEKQRKSLTTDEPQQRSSREEQPQHSSSDRPEEEPEPPQMKEELLEGDESDDTIIVTVVGDESDSIENVESHSSVIEFINQRLTAAAGEIYTELQRTITQNQEESHRRVTQIKEEEEEIEVFQMKEQPESESPQIKEVNMEFSCSHDSGSQHQRETDRAESGPTKEAALESNKRRHSTGQFVLPKEAEGSSLEDVSLQAKKLCSAGDHSYSRDEQTQNNQPFSAGSLPMVQHNENSTTTAAHLVCDLMAEEEEEENLMFLEEELIVSRALMEKMKGRRWNVSPLNTNRAEQGEFQLLVQPLRKNDQVGHFSYFRMSAVRFDDLVKRITPFIQHALTHRSPISIQERLAVTLCILASGRSQTKVAYNYRMGLSTVGVIMAEVIDAIWKALKDEFVDWPSPAKMVEIARDFWLLWKFPNCVGTISERRLTITLPSRAGRDFGNPKTQHSVDLMATCDARYMFTMVDIRAYSRQSDGAVTEQSSFSSAPKNQSLPLPPLAPLPGTAILSPHTFVGDAAFPLDGHLTQPYSEPKLTSGEQTFNQRHSLAHSAIENAFGIMAARWRILGQPMECMPDKVVDVVKACVALHNYLTCTDVFNAPASKYIPAGYSDTISSAGELQGGWWRREVEGDANFQKTKRPSRTPICPEAQRTRNHLMEFFQTPQGRVQ